MGWKAALVWDMARNMGPRYMLYRLRLMLETRLGVLEKRFPVRPETRFFIARSTWVQSVRFVLPPRGSFGLKPQPNPDLKRRADRIRSGLVPFFSATEFDLGPHFDWITHPETGKRYDLSKHWSRIPDLDPSMGDIKFVWEKSRFSYLHTVLRDDHHNGTDSAEWFFSELDSWIASNPINQGPNWRCSQEISLRCFNWLFGLSFYAHSEAFTDERWARYQNVFYWSLKHVYDHIDFSRIAVRNNHAITETAFLALSGVLFPFIPETRTWAADGKRWLEEEVAYQIYEDGTHLQFSTNYQRVVVQVLSLCLSVGRAFGLTFSDAFHRRSRAALDFLVSALEPSTGWLPNYGANDGALFFQFSDSDYSDFRPQLGCLSHALGVANPWGAGPWQEESHWFGIEPITAFSRPPERPMATAFPIGGFYGLREPETYAFVRCGAHKDRPSQADNLHLDLWYMDENWMRDAGSYKYNTSEAEIRYFAGTESHNALMIDGADQMLKGPRFVWFYWSQASARPWRLEEDEWVLDMTLRGFKGTGQTLVQHRSVRKKRNRPHWEITDHIEGTQDRLLVQRWHPHPGKIDSIHIRATDADGQFLERRDEHGWFSRRYGIKESVPQWSFACRGRLIRTTLEFTNP
ncbi:heparinase [bacterium]|nr:heparinase [bacterium]